MAKLDVRAMQLAFGEGAGEVGRADNLSEEVSFDKDRVVCDSSKQCSIRILFNLPQRNGPHTRR